MVLVQTSFGFLRCLFDEEGGLVSIDILQKGSATPPETIPEYARDWVSDLQAYGCGRLRSFSRSFRFPNGTAFQQRIWWTLLSIPYGQTRSYSWLAASVGSPGAARAAGQAVGKNPLPIVIPCHRIIAADGTLGGFSGGLEVKRRLLELEGIRLAACRS